LGGAAACSVSGLTGNPVCRRIKTFFEI